MWIGIGERVYLPTPNQTRPLPLSTAGCLDLGTDTPTSVKAGAYGGTQHAEKMISRPAIADTLYSLSYLYLSPIGTLIVMVVGLIVSLLTGGKNNVVDKKLLMTYKDSLCYNIYVNRSVHSENTIEKEELQAIADGKDTVSDQEPDSDKQNLEFTTNV
ncbi:sodium-coupled monocarboxylate transporter 1-like [Chiloscyllium punctatum]|uniref:sodium-coupled monocarboxylate transporter 1-like n=1 Tax=Chiloscyllium punctatum TaxID=137246 RepID=UPI003B632AFC